MKQRILFGLFALTFSAASAFAGTIGLRLNRTSVVPAPKTGGCEYSSGTVSEIAFNGVHLIGRYVAVRCSARNGGDTALTISLTLLGDQHVTLIGGEVGATGFGNGGTGPASNGLNRWPGLPFRSDHMNGAIGQVGIDFTPGDPKALPQGVTYTPTPQ